LRPEIHAPQRLQRFDQFIRGTAAAASAAAQTALDEGFRTLRDLQISRAANLARSMAEFAALGESQSRISHEVIAYLAAAATRREVMLAGIEAKVLSPFPQLPASPAATIRQQTALFHAQAIALEAIPADDQERLVRAAELRDAQRLAENLDLMIQRCTDLKLRQRLGSCRASLDTRHISTLASRRRRELVTPDLNSRILQEIAYLDLSHVPLRFEEETERGRNLFDVALDTRQRAEKSRVLSEGEQRALGIGEADTVRLPFNGSIAAVVSHVFSPKWVEFLAVTGLLLTTRFLPLITRDFRRLLGVW
jgi:hypothetical protein